MTQEELFALAQTYLDIMETKGEQALSDEQHTLLAYCYLDGQVQEGGFVQLIASGFGEYIFANPVADSLRRWQVKATPKVLDKAAALYRKVGQKIEQMAEEEMDLSVIRAKFEEFEELDAEYYEVSDEDLLRVVEYVTRCHERFVVDLS